MSEALTFKTKKHLLHALIDGKLGEAFGAQLISHACIRMMTGSKDMVEKLRLPETRAALKRMGDMNPEALQALIKGASEELFFRSARAASEADDPTPRIGGTADHGAR